MVRGGEDEMARTLTISGTVGGPMEYQIDGSYYDGQVNIDYYPSATDSSIWGTNWAARDLQQGGIVPLCISNEKEEVKDMRGLFLVYVVDPEEGDIVYQGVVVAENAKKAEFKVLSAAMRVSEDKYEVDDLDIICNRLGDIREKRKIQQVRVVDGD